VTRPATPPTPPTPPPPAAAPPPPALADGEASTLLDRLIYEQVIACVDVDELRALEQTIALLASELDGVGPDRAAELATAILDGALRRLPDEVRGYLDAASALCEDCPLCEDEARAARSPRRAARSKD
jgi:hypothetical protein